jgi:hypothetical protein
MIVVDEHDDQPRVETITRGGTRTIPDEMKKGNGVE